MLLAFTMESLVDVLVVGGLAAVLVIVLSRGKG